MDNLTKIEPSEVLDMLKQGAEVYRIPDDGDSFTVSFPDGTFFIGEAPHLFYYPLTKRFKLSGYYVATEVLE